MGSIARSDRPGGDRWGGRLLALGVAVVVCLPMLGRGYTLVYDMSFVPAPTTGLHSWGGDGLVPRAVPADFLLGLVGHVLPMSLVQQALVLAAVGLAALGAWRLSPAATIPGAAAAATCYAWGPYVGERLAMGHWSLLLGYALLPWLARDPVSRVAGERSGLPYAQVLLVALGAVAAPTAGVLTGVLALALLISGSYRWRDRAAVAGAVVLFNLTWALPGLVAAGLLEPDPVGVRAFAAASDNPLGGVVSLLTGGGVWNALVVLASRASVPGVVGALLLVGVAVVGWAVTRGRPVGDRATSAALVGVAALGLAVALVSLTGPGIDLLDRISEVPGGGILRDAQKWVAWYLLAVSVGIGVGAEWLVRRLRGPGATFVLCCVALVPLTTTPDLAYGVAGRLEGVSYPAEYADAARVVNDAPGDGAVLVLPWHAFRAWPWNDDRTTLDPWSRLVDRRVVVRDDLELVGGVVPGEDPVAHEVGQLVEAGDVDAASLRDLGIRFVVVDRATAGQDGLEPEGTALHDGPLVRVVDLGPVTGHLAAVHPRWIVAVVDLLAALLFVLALAGWCATVIRRPSQRRPT